MKKIITIYLALISISPICFGASALRYVISSECVTSIEVQETRYNQGWALLINLNKSAAEEMHGFSREYIGKKVSMIDGQGKNIIKNEIRVQGYLSSPFQLSGLSSQKQAIKAKQSILATKAKCGLK